MTHGKTMKSFLLIIVVISAINSVWSAPSSVVEEDIEVLPHLYEGDIILDDRNRNGLIDPIYNWPNATVVYELDSNFTMMDLSKIYAGWAEITSTTCIKFKAKTDSDPDWVFVRKGDEGSGCSSSVGRRGGRQNMNLEQRCVDRHGTVIHEMLHALGFYHEQSRPDRDDFLTVVWDKIEEGKEHNFDKHEDTVVSAFGAPYDFGSVLHYSGVGFSIDGSPTLIPKIPGVGIGQRTHISQLDAGKVRLMYNCPDEW